MMVCVLCWVVWEMVMVMLWFLNDVVGFIFLIFI